MSQRQTIPADVREVLEEIRDVLQSAEPEAIENATKDCAEATSPLPYVAGYLAAIVKCQGDRLERLLEKDAPAEKAKAP